MSWLDTEEVERLRTVYNKEHPKEDPVPEGTTEEVWTNIQHRLSDKCATGSAECIVASLMQRPKAPKEWAIKRDEWLSSDDIDRVEKNYTKLFSKYFFVGCIPIDFDLKSETQQCIVSSLWEKKFF